MKRIALIFITILLMATGCYVETKDSEEVILNVMAAASLTEAFNEIGKSYELENPTTKVQFNFAGSQILATQIQEGRHGDIFASANTIYMDRLIEKGFLESPDIFAQNKLIVAVNRKSSYIKDLQDLEQNGIMIAISDKTVPAGSYTDETLTKIQNSGEFGEDFKEKILNSTVCVELSVKDVIRKVEIGEVDAGFVYASDVNLKNKNIINIIDIKDEWNVIAKYPIGILKQSTQTEESIKFLDYLKSPKARMILESHGFDTE